MEEADVKILNEVDNRSGEIIDFLRDLIQIESITGNEGQIQDFTYDFVKSLGLQVEKFEPDIDALRNYDGFVEPEKAFKDRPNVVGVWKGSGEGKSLLLNGHVDTVPLEEADQWKFSPLSGFVSDGKVYGRGASDMKSGIAAMSMAVSILNKLNFQLKGDVILEYVVDEERTGIGTLSCVHRGYRADAGICCETSDLHVMPACIGRLWFTIKVQGKPTGISTRWKGVSAIDKANKIIQGINDLEEIRVMDLEHPLYPDNRGALPCAVTMIDAGTFPSITPERATLRGSLGLMPYEDPTEVEEKLRSHVMKIAAVDPWMRNHVPEISTKQGYVAAGAEIPVGHPIVEEVREAFKLVTGDSASLSGRMGAADTRFLINNGNTPTVIFGPGVTEQMHAMNEFVPIENLLISVKVLALAIYHWCR